jgi:hypothetical protein
VKLFLKSAPPNAYFSSLGCLRPGGQVGPLLIKEKQSPDLSQSKVAEIRKNIETLEKKVGGASN